MEGWVLDDVISFSGRHVDGSDDHGRVQHFLVISEGDTRKLEISVVRPCWGEGIRSSRQLVRDVLVSEDVVCRRVLTSHARGLH